MKLFASPLLLLLLLTFVPGRAQQSMEFSGINKVYQKGMDLYEKEKYAAAQEQFEIFLGRSKGTETGIRANARYFIAMCAMKLYHGDAEYLLDRFISEYPENSRVNMARYQMGKYQYRRKRYSKAVRWLKQVAGDQLPRDQQVEYRFKLGYSYYQQNSLDKASQAFYEIKDGQATFSSPALYYYSHIAYKQGNYQTALEGFEQLTENTTFSPIMPYYISQIYYLQEKYRKVTGYAPQYVRSASAKRLPEIAKIVGDAHYHLQEYDSALTYLQLHQSKAETLTRGDHYQLGYVAYRLDSLNMAIDHLEQVTGPEDEMAQNAYYHLADCYLSTGQKNKAKLAFEFASKLNFDPQVQENALFNYAKITFQLRNTPFNTAIKAFERYIERYPESGNTTQAYNYLVKAYMNSNNYQDALASLEELDQLDMPLRKAYQKVAYYRGLELYNNQNYEKAVGAFDKSLQYSNIDQDLAARCKYWKGEAYFQLGRFDKATGSYHRFIMSSGAFNSNLYERAHYNLGYAYFKLEDFNKAIKWFRKYIGFEDQGSSNYLADAYNRLGDAYFIQRSYWQAIDYYDQAIDLDVQDQDYALFQRGFALGLLNRPRKKVNTLKRLADRYPESDYIDDAYFEMGKSYVSLEQPQKAIDYFSRVVEDYPSGSYARKALVQLGLVYYNLDNNERSMEFYKRVIRNYPGTEQAKDALTGLKNIYVDQNRVNEYFDYVNGLGDYARVSVNEQDSLTYISAEKVYMQQNCSRATRLLRDYLKDFPKGSFRVNAHFYLADCLDRNGRPEQALAHYEQVIANLPNSFAEEALSGAAQITLDNKNYRKALDHLRKLKEVAELQGNIILARVGQMRACFALKMHDCALDAADQVLKTEKINDREKRLAHFIQAKTLFKQQKYSKAQEAFSSISHQVNSSQGAEAKYRIAQIYFRQEAYQAAEDEIFDFVEQNSSQEYWKARSFILLADVYRQTGDLFQAKHTLKSILDNYQPGEQGKGDILPTARSKYNRILEQEKQQNQPDDTTNDQMKIRLDQSVPDTTRGGGDSPAQQNSGAQNGGSPSARDTLKSQGPSSQKKDTLRQNISPAESSNPSGSKNDRHAQ